VAARLDRLESNGVKVVITFWIFSTAARKRSAQTMPLVGVSTT